MSELNFPSFKEASEFARALAQESSILVKVIRGTLDGDWLVSVSEENIEKATQAYRAYWSAFTPEMDEEDELYEVDNYDDKDNELELIQEEIQEDAHSYARSEEEGWYYED